MVKAKPEDKTVSWEKRECGTSSDLYCAHHVLFDVVLYENPRARRLYAPVFGRTEDKLISKAGDRTQGDAKASTKALAEPAYTRDFSAMNLFRTVERIRGNDGEGKQDLYGGLGT